MTAASIPAFKIEKHETGFALGEHCLICEESGTTASGSEIGSTLFLNGYPIQVLSRGPNTRSISDKKLVHLSCHPNQPYHHKCLAQWLAHSNSCPLDHFEVNSMPPSVQIPDIKNLDLTDLTIHHMVLNTLPIILHSIYRQHFGS